MKHVSPSPLHCALRPNTNKLTAVYNTRFFKTLGWFANSVKNNAALWRNSNLQVCEFKQRTGKLIVCYM